MIQMRHDGGLSHIRSSGKNWVLMYFGGILT